MKKIFWTSIYSGKKLMLWCVYLIFVLYIVKLVITTEQTGAKLIFAVIGAIVVSVILLFEYLKRKYDHMIYSLAMDCSIPQAEALKQQLIEKDIFHGFRRSIYIFDALLLLDKGDYQGCLNHLAAHEAFFRSTYDYLFIYYHTQLHCYYFLNQHEQAEQVLPALLKLKQLKKKQLSGLYSWEEIEGIKFYLQGRNKKSVEAFERVDTTLLNNREQAYLFYMMGRSQLAAGHLAEGNRLIKEARLIGTTLHIKTVGA